MRPNPATTPISADSIVNRGPRPANLRDMLLAVKQLRGQPIVSLDAAIEHLQLIDHATVSALQCEDPDLLRSKSSELVRRMLLSQEDLEHALALTAGVIEVDASGFEIDAHAFGLVPLRVQRSLDCLLLGENEGFIYAASWSPTREDMRARLSAMTSRAVMLVWGERDAIAARLERDSPLLPLPVAEQSALPGGISRSRHALPYSTGHRLLPEQQDIGDIMGEAVRELTSGDEPEESVHASESSSIVRMVKRIIIDAQAARASDIHIETNPGDQLTRIRFRRDGDMEKYQELPPQLRAPLVSRIKVMAGLDISERRRPQDGRIAFHGNGSEHLELRVTIIPTHDGMEDAVLRLLTATKPIPLEQLGLQTRDRQAIAKMSARSYGLILAAGPTGSGKTTTLHSMLAEINTEEKKIWTAEDPIEITQAGLRQVQVNSKIGVTFASAMRGFLRADPDIIMIGEIRDSETAKIAIEASLTGHLVLSTLHTNNAAESVVRLLDLGIDTMNFADSLVGIVAQRLVRALCGHCAHESAMPPGLFADVVKEYCRDSPLSEASATDRLLAAAGVRAPQEVRFKTAHGCERCGGKGYKGRLGIYEILQNSPAIRLLIQRNARPGEIHDQALHEGMRSLRHDALEKWVQGKIDLHQARSAYL